MTLKLGRRPAVADHVSLVRSQIIADYLDKLPPPPDRSPDWIKPVMDQSPEPDGGWGMDGNDQFGCCVFSDCAHQEMLRTANVGTIWTPSTDEVLALYSAVTGFNQNDPSTDQGADELSTIEYLTNTGWQGRKLDGHANLNVKKLDQLKWTVNIFGASRLGINLPQSAIDQFNSNKPWDVVKGSQCAGGHDVPLVGYDAPSDTYYIVTWGKLWEVSGDFMKAKFHDGTPYLEEAHAELAFDWVNSMGTSPSKQSLVQLLQDLTSVTKAMHTGHRHIG